ncbi:hypothetical protein I7331_06350 [Frankia sp. AgB1.8]|nr:MULTISPECIES: hypothetical protein [unclassified Frankia]MBL7618858.1 hypothetical protein [Frankia sp. AgB1.8]
MTTETAPPESESAPAEAETAPAETEAAATAGPRDDDARDRPAGAGARPAGVAGPEGDAGPAAVAEPVATAPRVRGPGRTLVAVYAVFAVAATSRAVVQIITKFHEAPVAYLLSALAGVIYILATVGLSRPSALGRRVATGACAAELTGVLTVGTLSVVDRGLFPDAAVWSGYGAGYVFLPLVLPVLGLWWLRRSARGSAEPVA